MEETQITITIADRPYPLTVEKKEEQNVMKAAKIIDQKLTEYSSNYSFSDKQDLLAMVVLQFTTSFLNGEKLTPSSFAETYRPRLTEIIRQLDELLKEK